MIYTVTFNPAIDYVVVTHVHVRACTLRVLRLAHLRSFLTSILSKELTKNKE